MTPLDATGGQKKGAARSSNSSDSSLFDTNLRSSRSDCFSHRYVRTSCLRARTEPHLIDGAFRFFFPVCGGRPRSADRMNASRLFFFFLFPLRRCDRKVFGTSTGSILITDYHGNESRRLRPHTMAVTDLSLDIRGDFLARQGIFSGARGGGGGGWPRATLSLARSLRTARRTFSTPFEVRPRFLWRTYLELVWGYFSLR